MSTIPQKRLILGWLKESGWGILLLLLSPLSFFYKSRHLEGHRKQTVFIMCDLLANPLLYFRLAHRLNKRGFSVWLRTSASLFKGLADHAHQLGDFLEEQDLNDVILIGHGMGGMVPLKLPDAPRQRIKHLIPVGTPYNGSRLLLAFRIIPALRDMAVGSEFILFNRANCMLYPKFTPFTAWQDEMIVPFNLARYGQGRDLIVDQVGHYNLLMESENIDTIIEIIERAYPEATNAVEMAMLEHDYDQPQIPISLRSKARPLSIVQTAPPSGTEKTKTKKRSAKKTKARSKANTKKAAPKGKTRGSKKKRTTRKKAASK